MIAYIAIVIFINLAAFDLDSVTPFIPITIKSHRFAKTVERYI
jgi:hypothetical protein